MGKGILQRSSAAFDSRLDNLRNISLCGRVSHMIGRHALFQMIEMLAWNAAAMHIDATAHVDSRHKSFGGLQDIPYYWMRVV